MGLEDLPAERVELEDDVRDVEAECISDGAGHRQGALHCSKPFVAITCEVDVFLHSSELCITKVRTIENREGIEG